MADDEENLGEISKEQQLDSRRDEFMSNEAEVEQPVVQPDSAGTVTDLYVETGVGPAFRRSLVSPYLYANMIYVAYAWINVSIDMNETVYDIDTINKMYLGANIIHLLNALLYIWVWVHEGFSWWSPIQIPEVLNIIEASLYIASSTYYPYINYNYIAVYPDNSTLLNDTCNCDGADDITYLWAPDPVSTLVQNIEITASIIATLAAVGWFITWYLTYRRVPGRGWTLDDPDVWAILTINIGALMYLIYNADIVNDRELYGSLYLYVYADYIYVINSFFYLFAALRDAGWFWASPTAGMFRFEQRWARIEKQDIKKG